MIKTVAAMVIAAGILASASALAPAPKPTPAPAPQQVLEQTACTDAELIAKTIYGEANFLTEEERAQVAWCILNRVDSSQFPDSIADVVTQRGQFDGYRESYPVTEENLAIAEDVIARWEAGSEDRELGKEFLFFYGDGQHNHFREEY